MSGAAKLMDILQDTMLCGFKEVYFKICQSNSAAVDQEKQSLNLLFAFWSIVITIFIADLQALNPSLVKHIFDIFLVDG
jgi:hypothetical protein